MEIIISVRQPWSNGGIVRHLNGYTYFLGKSNGEGAVLSNGDGTATIKTMSPGGSNGYIKFESGAGSEAMRINDLGNIGIGTDNPGKKLEIKSDSEVNNGMVIRNATGGGIASLLQHEKAGYLTLYDNGTPKVYISSHANTNSWINNGGNVGIGTLNPNTTLTINKNSTSSGVGAINLRTGDSNDSFLTAGISSSLGYAFISSDQNGTGSVMPLTFRVGATRRMTIVSNGNVGIGTTNPGSYKLAVEGKIGAREVVVTTDGWADYVFAPQYKLRALEEVEKFVKKNKHLPGVKPEKEIKKNGLAMGEMQTKMMEKIEELTLYMIEQNKQLKSQKAELTRLQNENQKMKAALVSLQENKE